MLNVAIKAARAAGAIINRAALDVEAVRISQKQVNDFVTEVDHASEQVIIETLLTAYPDHGILAEESGSQHGNPHADHIWIIDPLDGTTNFIHGFPVYCVSIALQVRGKLEQAVVYDPSRNDLFTATKGRGAFMNERRIRVSKRVRLEECLLSTGFPFRPEDDFDKYLRLMGDRCNAPQDCAAPVLLPWTSRMWQQVLPTVSLKWVCNPGTWLLGLYWSQRLVDWWVISVVKRTIWSTKNAWPLARGFMPNWFLCYKNILNLPRPMKNAKLPRPPRPCA